MQNDTIEPQSRGRILKKIINGEGIMLDIAKQFIEESMLTQAEVDYSDLSRDELMASMILFKHFGSSYRIVEIEDLIKAEDLKEDRFSFLERPSKEQKEKYSKLQQNITAFFPKIDKEFFMEIIEGTENNIEFLKQRRFEHYLKEAMNENIPASEGEAAAQKRALYQYRTEERIPGGLSEEDKETLGIILRGGSARNAGQNGMKHKEEDDLEMAIPKERIKAEAKSEGTQKAEAEAKARGAITRGLKLYSDEPDGPEKIFSTHYFDKDKKEVYQFGSTLERLILGYKGTNIDYREWSEEEMEELQRVQSI